MKRGYGDDDEEGGDDEVVVMDKKRIATVPEKYLQAVAEVDSLEKQLKQAKYAMQRSEKELREYNTARFLEETKEKLLAKNTEKRFVKYINSISNFSRFREYIVLDNGMTIKPAGGEGNAVAITYRGKEFTFTKASPSQSTYEGRAKTLAKTVDRYGPFALWLMFGSLLDDKKYFTWYLSAKNRDNGLMYYINKDKQ